MKRMISCSLALLLALSLLAGCVPNSTNSGANTPGGTDNGVVDRTDDVRPNDGVDDNTVTPRNDTLPGTTDATPVTPNETAR